jgi:phosphoribosylformimino-5-aminoimidazole carboxamide ribotide isomerase
VFSEDPVEAALQWQSLGAPRLHIVDLDGAAEGSVRNIEIVIDIARALLIPTQLGGGIRDIETIHKLLKAGVERVILGTAAVEDPQLVKDACKRFRDTIVVGVDAKDGFVATHGWLKPTEIRAATLARGMTPLGVKRFVYTDISRDGTLTEPNFTATAEFINTIRKPVIAAGGIATLNHLKMLRDLGAEGAIVGTALYTGDINLKEALEVISQN